MAKLDDFDDELVDRLRKSTAEFIESVEAAYQGELPVRTIYIPEDERIAEKEISRPRPVLEHFRHKGIEAFRETAEWIEANPDRSYRWEGEIFDPSLESEQPYLDDLVYDPDQEQLIKAFENDLVDLSTEIVESTGELTWEEEAFEKAAERFLIDMSFMGPLGPKSINYKTIFPLIDFSLKGDKIELESDLHIINRQDGEWISQIEISELTPTEIATIYTQENSRHIGEKGAFGETSHAIKISMNGSPYAANDDQIRAAVVTGLRLFNPWGTAVHGDKGYRMMEGPLTYREGIQNIYASTKPMSKPLPPYFRGTYELDSSGKKLFEEFWSRYKNEFNTKTDNNISKSLRRFNEMYRKSNIEDQIVDCAIALEGTLLQDIKPGSSLTFRLMLRSGLLLGNHTTYSREVLREIFRAIYIARGEIVHSNRRLNEIIEGNDRFELFGTGKPAPRRFIAISRSFLAQTLLRYIIGKVNNGKSVAEINQEMDTAALNANY